jgi:uncharacterized protein (TIGR02145 family)
MKKMFFLMLTLLIWSAASVNAQVTIGSDKVPHSGAVLDLQSDNLGLKLPNVELDDTDLTEFVLPLTAPSTKEEAKGMYVYNTNATLGEGVYVWDGYQWILVKESVGEKPVTAITIFSETGKQSVLPSGTLQLSARITPNDATNANIKWSIDIGSGNAYISQTGLLHAYQPGLVKVRASVDNIASIWLSIIVTREVPVTQKLWNGNNEYDTYDFGGDVWMLENSMEGTPNATCYDDDISKSHGYYYSRSTAFLPAGSPDSPCQTGWHLPTAPEADRLVAWLLDEGVGTGVLAEWAPTYQMGGDYRPSQGWEYWETAMGIWVRDAAMDALWSAEQPIHRMNRTNDALLLVRCVQDKP